MAVTVFDDTVDRKTLTWFDHDQVTHAQLGDGDLLLHAIDDP